MAIIATAPEGGKFEKCPIGTFQAVCSNVYDLGIQHTKYEKDKHEIVILWEINETIKEGKFIGKRFTISKRYTLSLFDSAALRADLEAWRGRSFTETELKGFDVESVIGTNCMISIREEVGKDGKERRKVSSVSALMKGLEKLIPELPRSHKPEWVSKIQSEQIHGNPPNNATESDGTFGDEVPF